MSTQVKTISPQQLQELKSRGRYAPLIELMNGLEPDDPKLMDVAVPANRACGSLHAA